MRWFITAGLLAVLTAGAAGREMTVSEVDGGGVRVESAFYTVDHNPARGGSITRITIKAGDKTVPVEMSDGMSAGGDRYLLVHDNAAKIRVDRAGDGKTAVVSVVARYVARPDKRDTAPAVAYRYTYHADSPLVRIDAKLPRQHVERRFDRLEQFLLNLGDKPFDRMQRLVTGGDGAIMPTDFTWSACETRPNAGMLYRDERSALAIVTPTAGSFRLDAEAMHVTSRGFLDGWMGRELTSGATLYLGPADQAEAEIAGAARGAASAAEPPVWRARLKDTQTGAWILLIGDAADASQAGDTTTWKELPAGPGRVSATLTRKTSNGLTHGSLAIEPLDERLSVCDVTYPIVKVAPKAGEAETDYLVFPYKAGARIPNPTAAGLWDGEYPGAAGWPFLAYWQGDRGVYVGVHDPRAGVKTISSLPTGDGTLELSFTLPAPGAGTPGNGFDMGDAVAVTGPFQGDWYDAAMIYRDWMVEQPWFPDKPLHANPDVPQWLKDTVVATRRSGPPTNLRDNIELHEDSGYKEYHTGVFEEHDVLGNPPTLLWWYHAWFGEHGEDKFHATPEWPAPPGFRQGVDELKARGIRVISYSLNNWWGYENESWKREGAEKALLIQEGGSPWIYTRRDVGVMCSGSELFQREMQRVMNLLLDQGDVDGTYFDLGGTAGASLCYSTEHGHPIGSGAWVTEAKRRLKGGMRAAARKRNDDFVIVMEGNADCYLDVVDGYAIFAENLPVRQALYADYRRTAGGKRVTWERSKLEAITPAKHFAWGGLIGRFVSSELIHKGEWDPKKVAYYKRLVHHKWVARPWLNLGRMLRPVAVTDLSPAGPREFVADTMLPHAAWRAPDGTVAFVFANARHTTPVSFGWRASAATYDIPADGSWALYRLEPQGQPPVAVWEKVSDIGATIARTETLEPGGTLILVAKP